MFSLRVVTGEKAGTCIPVRGATTVGRNPESDLPLADSNVSREHAAFEVDGDELRVRDLGSSNGTFVNEKRVEEASLSEGDQVRVGSTIFQVDTGEKAWGAGRTAAFRFAPSDPRMTPYASLPLSAAGAPPPAQTTVAAVQQRLDTVMQIAEGLASISSFDTALERALDSLLEVYPQAERAFIMSGDTFESLVPRAVRHRDGRDQAEAPALSSTLCRAAIEKREVVVYRTEPDKSEWAARSLVTLNIWSALVLPLMVRDEILGILVVDTTDHLRPFKEADLQLAAAVGRQIAISVNNAALVEQAEREALTKKNLMRFLPAPVAEMAMRGKVEIDLGGTRCTCTALFADLVGFTSLSERMSPEQIVGMMNLFFDRMVPCINAEGGAIDKFIGDCVMALWGIPFEEENHALLAARAGLAMQTALWILNRSRAADGEPPLAMGVGFESGPVVAGNIGSNDRMEYTVIGDTVNTAMRIESRACAGQVLAGPAAWARLAENACGVRLPPLSVKNKAEPLTTVAVRAARDGSESLRLHIPVRVDGRALLLTRRLDGEVFEALHADDVPLGADDALDLACVELRAGGVAHVHEVLTTTRDEAWGGLRATRFHVDDPSLGGLLGDGVLDTKRAWAEMPRGAPSPGDPPTDPLGLRAE